MRVIRNVDDVRAVCRAYGENDRPARTSVRERSHGEEPAAEAEREAEYGMAQENGADFPSLNRLPDDTVPVGDLHIYIRSLCAKDAGERLCVTVELIDEVRDLSEKRTLVLLTSLSDTLQLRTGEISQEALCELEQAEQLSLAVGRGVSILACGTNSRRMLQQKLRSRGFGDDISHRAAEILAEKGYIRENEDVCREAERAARKGWGARRIEQHLRMRGYLSGAVREAMEQFDPADFDDRCAEVAARYMANPPADAAERKKLTAFLIRYGYEMSQIRYAMKNAWTDGENAGSAR